MEPLQKTLVTCVTKNLIHNYLIVTDDLPPGVHSTQTYTYKVSIEFLPSTPLQTVKNLINHLTSHHQHLGILKHDIEIRPERYVLHLQTKYIK